MDEEWRQNQETDTEKAHRRHEGRRVEGYHVRVRKGSGVMMEAASEISRIVCGTQS